MFGGIAARTPQSGYCALPRQAVCYLMHGFVRGGLSRFFNGLSDDRLLFKILKYEILKIVFLIFAMLFGFLPKILLF